MSRLAVLDIGGTHARFAIATLASGGAIALDDPITLKTGDYPGLAQAWAAFAERLGTAPPRDAAIAIAAPVTPGRLRMTNNAWEIDTATLAADLGIDRTVVLNDFAAVAHAAASLPHSRFDHLAGPDEPLPASGTISVIGPGTGLGVAHFHRFAGTCHVQATEGGHVDFAPLDKVEDALLRRLRLRHGRVSVERVVSGPGLVDIYATLATLEGRAIGEFDDRTLWARGIAREDRLAAAAVERFCQSLGSVAGDFALAHGAGGVVIAGGLGLRLRETLRQSGFAERFRCKGRYEQLMGALPVRLITHPEPGLYGAAAAFAKDPMA